MSTGMRKWMENGCPEIQCLPAQVSIDREELRQLREELRQLREELAQYKNERDVLRAKIEQMERQEPVGVLHVGSYYGEELEDWEFEADQRVCDRLNEQHVTNPTSLKLYALPGAQPAPSTKDAIIDDLQSQFNSEGITEHNSGDALIRLSDAIAAVEDNFAQPAPGVPDGWQLVPIEPTLEMLRALIDGANQCDSWNEGYREMLAAAPAPEVKP